MIIGKSLKPHDGDQRQKIAFALFPRSITNDRWIWLEKILVTQRFNRGCDYGGCWATWETKYVQPLSEAMQNDRRDSKGPSF